MLKMKYWTPAAASSSMRATNSSGVPMSEVVGSSPVTWRRKSRVDAVSSALLVSTRVLSRLTVTSDGSRPTASQWPRRTSTL